MRRAAVSAKSGRFPRPPTLPDRSQALRTAYRAPRPLSRADAAEMTRMDRRAAGSCRRSPLRSRRARGPSSPAKRSAYRTRRNPRRALPLHLVALVVAIVGLDPSPAPARGSSVERLETFATGWGAGDHAETE